MVRLSVHSLNKVTFRRFLYGTRAVVVVVVVRWILARIVVLAALEMNMTINRYLRRSFPRTPWVIPHRQESVRFVSWIPQNKPSVIIEEPGNKNVEIEAIKHLLRSQEIPKHQQQELLKVKLKSLIDNQKVPEDMLSMVNEMFLEIYKSNAYIINEKVLENKYILKLVNKSCMTLLAKYETIDIPEYLSILILHILKSNMIVWDKTLVRIVLLLSRSQGSSLKDSLNMLSKSNVLILSSFITTLITTLETEKKLSLLTFETIAKLASTDTFGLDLTFYNIFINHVRRIALDQPLQVHEYNDLDKNIFRIQELVNAIVQEMDMNTSELETNLKIMVLLWDLNGINHSPDSDQLINGFIEYLNGLEVEQISLVLVRQENESFGLKVIAMLNGKESPLAHNLYLSIIEHGIFYSTETILQAQVYLGNMSLQEAYKQENVDADKLLLRVCQLYAFTDKLTYSQIKAFTKEFVKDGHEISVVGYKLLLGKLIETKDLPAALDLFHQTTNEYVQWALESLPEIRKTLNDLIILSMEKISNIEEVFEIFTEIRQQMAEHPINIHAINSMTRKMLENEYVGDLIEMLKRELPHIETDDIVKLPLDIVPYRQLFDTIQLFVTEFTNETTFETNWVLYGELHKYFNVPFETYLPTMKFFIDHGRLTSALTIFRQIRRLHELHGNHNFLPPLKQMYIYLLDEFGDNLYEEGVEEVHECVKLDVILPKQDLALQNSLLNAYSNLQDVTKTRNLFAAMLPLHNSIDEKTVQIMIKTYTYSDLNHVKSFWNNMSSFDVLPNHDIFRQYLIAHVYHGFPQEAIALVGEMDDYGLQMTEDILVAMFNFSLRPQYQRVIEEWGQANYEVLWHQADAKGLFKKCNNYIPDNLLLETSTAVQSN